MYKRILVPLDGSEKAEEVLPFTCMLARDNSAEIILLHVAEYPLEIYPASYEYSYVDTRLAEVIDHKKSDFRYEVKNYLANIAKEGFNVRTEVCEGPVVESILSATEYQSVDLITMATHTDNEHAYWLIGSIANRVLHEANVQVILIRPTTTSSTRIPSPGHGIFQPV